ncbi:acetolactate decarboxylase [Enterococcus alishanensis]|uniref:Alpha-acetolactate decarboxylase n=1 Tax=Enterococcus alishanensis TaxID=1303817 RepID=A0ABS6T9U1_9ENTE|nr:acetolactate decarboxylase [Enterococcus alishanensis]
MNTLNYLYQHGTLGGLMASLMDGTVAISDMLQQGDLGIGTLSGSNGELVILDGVAYHVNEEGNVHILTGQELATYSAVTKFVQQQTFPIERLKDSQEVKQEILDKLSPNLFAAVKITGTFQHMHVRVVQKQEKPYPKFVEVARHQPEFETNDVKGTIVGFFTPSLFHGASVAGFHLHFISDDRTFGGHVLDFKLSEGKVALEELEEFRQHFPINDEDFLEQEIDFDSISKDIEEAE